MGNCGDQIDLVQELACRNLILVKEAGYSFGETTNIAGFIGETSGTTAFISGQVSYPEAPPSITLKVVHGPALSVMLVASTTTIQASVSFQHEEMNKTPAEMLWCLHLTRIQELVCEIRQLPQSWASQLAERVLQLIDAVKEEQPNTLEVIAIGSLRNLVDFLKSWPRLKRCPTLFVASGLLRAQWRLSPRQHFSVDFSHSGSDVSYVLFAPDIRFPDLTTRLSQMLSRDALFDAVRPYGVLGWLEE